MDLAACQRMLASRGTSISAGFFLQEKSPRSSENSPSGVGDSPCSNGHHGYGAGVPGRNDDDGGALERFGKEARVRRAHLSKLAKGLPACQSMLESSGSTSVGIFHCDRTPRLPNAPLGGGPGSRTSFTVAEAGLYSDALGQSVRHSSAASRGQHYGEQTGDVVRLEKTKHEAGHERLNGGVLGLSGAKSSLAPTWMHESCQRQVRPGIRKSRLPYEMERLSRLRHAHSKAPQAGWCEIASRVPTHGGFGAFLHCNKLWSLYWLPPSPTIPYLRLQRLWASHGDIESG